MKYFLRFLLALFLVGILALVWFFNIRATKRVYVNAAPLPTKTYTVRTADFNENRNAYFGDLHVHTSWSFDAFIFNVRTTPDDAYNFGKGKAIPHVSGKPIQMGRPLDFMAVTDHAEYMGVMMQMLDAENPLANLDIAKEINSSDRDISLKAYGSVGRSLALSWPYKKFIDKDILQTTWQRIVAAADRHNEPGKFTTFPAYEWTSNPTVIFAKERYAQNLHRNVIFKGGKVSGVPFSAFNSQDPEDLWDWMDKERTKGIELLAIPHNANVSNGLMYDTKTKSGKALTASYAQTRSRNEPINEVVQMKGQSMTHPVLSPNDEFADYELYAFTFSQGGIPPPSQPEHSYVREALGNGLAFEKSLGTNPFKFGFIGSTDGHNGASAIEEDNFIGKLGSADDTPEKRMNELPLRPTKFFSAAGLAGVWAKENTREAIYEAMERKETFATSGTRIKLRFFAGWDMEVDSLSGTSWLDNAYANGVPMGSDLKPSLTMNNSSPSFIVQAIKDSDGANLDRVQIIKAYLDNDGTPQESIFEVSWSGDRHVDAKGKLPPIGTTVDVATATYTNAIGAVSLQTTWKDPTFDVSQSAVYYVRVLEIPTPRWTTYDAATLGVAPLSGVPTTTQERAWSSPIWYDSVTQ
ncbi:MAG: hypothetical protein ACI9FN_000357 [Saprospiraceae bacterium]|jgi:hypothetical protein